MILTIGLGISLIGCQQLNHDFGKRNVGMVAGGATGTLAADALFDGSAVGIAAGAVAGAVAGSAIAENQKD